MSLHRLLEDHHELVVDHSFADGAGLDTSVWIPHHLPQWSSRERAAARYRVDDGALRLRVEASQPPWCPEFDGATRVSSLQTGVRSGPVGSGDGQHRFTPEALVREAQEEAFLHTPERGALVLRCRAELDDDSMAALWMVGIEDEPEHSGVVDVMEVFGRDAGGGSSAIGMGVHPFGDPDLSEEHEGVVLDLDVGEPHEYGLCWTERSLRFYVDDRQVREVRQSPRYPMQIMLGVYSFVDPTGRDPAGVFEPMLEVQSFRSYRPRR